MPKITLSEKKQVLGQCGECSVTKLSGEKYLNFISKGSYCCSMVFMYGNNSNFYFHELYLNVKRKLLDEINRVEENKNS